MKPLTAATPQEHEEGARALAHYLEGASSAEAAKSEQLFPLHYRELHRVARRHLYEHGAMTLGATTLLHEAYLDLHASNATFPDRARFFAYTARVMRGLIIDHVRERQALKRGGEFHIKPLDTQIAETVAAEEDLIPLDEALDDLVKIDPELAELVELKFFSGFSFSQIAQMRQVSERTVRRDWQKAKLLLHGALREN